MRSFSLPMVSQVQCRTTFTATRTNVLLDLNKANTDQHDKAILQLTAGALALTVTFMEKIAPHPLPNTQYWLAGGWALLAASMAAMVLSFLTGQNACRRQLALLDIEFREGMRPPQTNRWSSQVFYGVDLAGVVAILVFSWLNLTVDVASSAAQQTIMHGGTSQVNDTSKPIPVVPTPQPVTPSQPNPGHGHTPPPPPAMPPRPIAPPATK